MPRPLGPGPTVPTGATGDTDCTRDTAAEYRARPARTALAAEVEAAVATGEAARGGGRMLIHAQGGRFTVGPGQPARSNREINHRTSRDLFGPAAITTRAPTAATTTRHEIEADKPSSAPETSAAACAPDLKGPTTAFVAGHGHRVRSRVTRIHQGLAGSGRITAAAKRDRQQEQ